MSMLMVDDKMFAQGKWATDIIQYKTFFPYTCAVVTYLCGSPEHRNKIKALYETGNYCVSNPDYYLFK